MSARMKLVPDGYDQVGRRARFEAAHPAMRIWEDGRDWRGAWSLGGDPLLTKPHWQLNGLLDELDCIAAMDAERRLLLAEFPGWHAYVTGAFEWAAFPLGWHSIPPPLLTAPTAAGLRAAITAARESWRMPVPEAAR